MDSLKIASLSGIKISLIFPKKADHFTVNKASQTYLAELVRAGVKFIYIIIQDSFILKS